jgi:hypothetical protein
VIDQILIQCQTKNLCCECADRKLALTGKTTKPSYVKQLAIFKETTYNHLFKLGHTPKTEFYFPRYLTKLFLKHKTSYCILSQLYTSWTLLQESDNSTFAHVLCNVDHHDLSMPLNIRTNYAALRLGNSAHVSNTDKKTTTTLACLNICDCYFLSISGVSRIIKTQEQFGLFIIMLDIILLRITRNYTLSFLGNSLKSVHLDSGTTNVPNPYILIPPSVVQQLKIPSKTITSGFDLQHTCQPIRHYLAKQPHRTNPLTSHFTLPDQPTTKTLLERYSEINMSSLWEKSKSICVKPIHAAFITKSRKK